VSLDLNVPEPGQLVDVRQRRYVVVDVAQSVLPPDFLKRKRPLQLSSEPTVPRKFGLLIVDEAHNIALSMLVFE
jgi:superfamily II DNA or RNA helicase